MSPRVRPSARLATSSIRAALLGLLLPAVLASPTAAEAQEPPFAALEPAPADTELWGAAALNRMLAERDYAGLLVLTALSSLLSDPAPLAGDGADPLAERLDEALALAERMQRLRAGPTALAGCAGQDDAVAGILCSLEQLAPGASLASARALTDEGTRLVASLTAARDSVARGLGREVELGAASVLVPFHRVSADALDEVRELRRGLDALSDEGRSTLDRLLGEVTGFSPEARADELLGSLPGLGELLERHPLPSRAREIGGSLDDVVGEYRAFLDRAREPLAAGPGALVDAAAERAWVHLAARSAELAGGQSHLVERIRTLGNAAVELRQSSSLLQTGLAAGREAATLALGGQLIGVAAGLTAYFAGHPVGLGPGAAEEVRAIRDALEATRSEMGEGFAAIDRRLDETLDLVTNRLDRLETLVASEGARTREELQALHLEVRELGERFDRLEETLRSYVEAGFDRDFNRTLIVCLEHRERHLPPFDRMDYPTFAGCLADFRARAERDARDALLTDRATQVDDASLQGALADHSFRNLARRLPLLERAAAARFGYGAMQGRRELANPIEWAMASQAYLTMLSDWPEHAGAVAPGDLEAMRLAGIDVRNALQAITIDPVSGAEGRLLLDVLGYHRTHARRLVSEADLLATRHQQAELRRVPRSAIASRILPPAGSGLGELEVPAFIAGAIPAEVRTAGVLALGEAVLSYRLATVERAERERFRRRWVLFGKRHDRITWSRTSIEVELRFGGGEPIGTWGAEGEWVLTRIEEMAGGEESEQVRSVEHFVPDPARRFVREEWPALRDDEERWRARGVPAGVVARLEGEIEAELRRHASAALDDVFRAVCSPDDDPALAAGADRNSVIAIREALRAMGASRALLRGYVGLGLPQVVDGEAGEPGEALLAGLHGTDALLDRDGLCGAVEAGESPLRLVWLDEEPLRRAEALEGSIGQTLEALPAHRRGFPMIDVTLDRLETAVRLQRLRADLVRRGS